MIRLVNGILIHWPTHTNPFPTNLILCWPQLLKFEFRWLNITFWTSNYFFITFLNLNGDWDWGMDGVMCWGLGISKIFKCTFLPDRKMGCSSPNTKLVNTRVLLPMVLLIVFKFISTYKSAPYLDCLQIFFYIYLDCLIRRL